MEVKLEIPPFVSNKNSTTTDRKPFFVRWTIFHLTLWSKELHEDSVDIFVNFNGKLNGVKLFPRNVDGRMEVRYSGELARYDARLTFRGPDESVVSSCQAERKEEGEQILPGPQFELFRQQLRITAAGWTADRFYLDLTFENACASPRHFFANSSFDVPLDPKKFRLLLFGQPPSMEHPSVAHEADVLQQQDQQVGETPPLFTNLSYVGDMAPLPRQRMNAGFCISARHPTLEQLVPSLENLSIGREAKEPPIGLNADCCISTRHPTLEQLVPSLENLSISQEAEEPSSSSDRLEERTPLSDECVDYLCKKIDPSIGSLIMQVGVKYLNEKLIKTAGKFLVKTVLERRHQLHMNVMEERYKGLSPSERQLNERRRARLRAKYGPY